MYNNNCCCDCGLKYSICIMHEIIDSNLLDSIELNYEVTQRAITLKDCVYQNLLNVEVERDDEILNFNVCISSINFFKLIPVDSNYQPIINIINKYYQSPFCISTCTCDNICCCKDSYLLYLRDKYLESEPENRNFKLKFLTLNGNNTIPDSDDDSSVIVITLDNDVVWLLDTLNKVIYLASLCQIKNAISIS